MNTTLLNSFSRAARLRNSLGVASLITCTAFAQPPAAPSSATRDATTPADKSNSSYPNDSAAYSSRANRDMAGGKLTRNDRQFIEKAGELGMTNMAISQIAVSRATNPQVRECAQMLVSDHGPVNDELKTFAAAHSVDLSMKTVNTDKWQKKDGDFDKDYIAKMTSDHKETVNLFEKQSTKGDNPELKAWAAKTLPALQAHLAKIESLKTMMK